MAITALHSAATGMKAMDIQLDVLANNLANSNTWGFKSSRVNFEDLFYEARRQPGALNSLGERNSTGLFVGLGVRESNTQFDFTVGSPEATGQPLDVAIAGQGFFRVRTHEGIGGGIAYTRAGNFMQNRDGDLVLGTSSGPRIDPPINLPIGYELVTIREDGTVTVRIDGEDQEVGQLQLFKFPNPHGLSPEGGNLYTITAASGEEIAGNPSDAGFGVLIQNHLEASNVDPVKELVRMIRTQRTFELNSQTIRAADETLQVINRMRR